MKVVLPFILSAIISVSLSAQSLTVSQLETKWHALYDKAANAVKAKKYTTAEKELTACIELLNEHGAVYGSSHIRTLTKLGELYYLRGQNQRQEQITKEILSINSMIKPGSKRHVNYLYNLGVFYSNTDNYKKAIDCLDNALKYMNVLEMTAGEKAKVLHRKALCHFCLNDKDKAISVEKNAISFDDNKTPDYYQSLAYYYFKNKDWAGVENIINDCFNNTREPLLRKFTASNSAEKAEYWSKAGLFFTEFLPTYAYLHPSEQLTSYAYNAALLSKGVLLATENKSAELTLNSNDPDLIQSYSHYLALKGKKDRTIEEEFEMNALSNVFIQYQKEHKNDYRKDFRILWQDIQERLDEDGIAIEFITIPNNDGFDDYAALVIKKDYTAPKLIKLANFKELSAVTKENYYKTSELYQLVWGPLESELKGIQNVFFSPAGIFHNTGIEYLPDKDGINLNSRMTLCRLSSTKELCFADASKEKSCILFGGLDYNTRLSTLVAQSKKLDSKEDCEFRVPLDSLDLRESSASGGFSFLNGTLEEVGEISMTLLEEGIPTDLFTGEDGSEMAFKSLTWTKSSMLHLATHGFYYSNPTEGRKISLDRLFKDINLHYASDDIHIIDEDKMLTRSGLIMAGANNILNGNTIPKGIDDGVLYAGEIATINLSNVDLLVLSACQSGLGDIASSEGVFGLQRGFKLAGVQSIVMSLWKVNDDTTRILMTEMYKNIAAGQTVREALYNAQLTLRLYDNGKFDNPDYWAAFVLLDAIN